MDFAFQDAEAPTDEIPLVSDVTDPCRKCSREIDIPYSGRGPRPKLCSTCKGSAGKRSAGPRVTGNAQNLAAQATGVLVQLNAMLGLAAGALGFFETGKAIIAGNEQFESQAYQALLTDPEFCKAILKTGAKSAKLSLGMAYGGMLMSVIPTMAMEMKAKKAVAEARKLGEDNNYADADGS